MRKCLSKLPEQILLNGDVIIVYYSLQGFCHNFDITTNMSRNMTCTAQAARGVNDCRRLLSPSRR